MANNVTKDTSLQSTKQMLDELDALMERMLSLPVHDPDNAPAFPKEVVKEPVLSASLTLLEAEPPSASAASVAPPPSVGPTTATVEAAPVSATPPQSSGAPTQVMYATLTAPVPSATTDAPPPPRPLDRPARTKSSHLSVNTPHFAAVSSKPLPFEPVADEKPAHLAPAASLPEIPPLTNEAVPPTVLPTLAPLLAEVPAVEVSSSAWAFTPLLGVNQAFDNVTEYLGSAGAWLRSLGGRMVLGFSGIALFLAAIGWVVADLLGWNW